MTLGIYNRSARDTATLDHGESVLGHLILERQLDVYTALTLLSPTTKAESKGWEDVQSMSSIGFWAGFVSAGAVFMAVGAGPVGLAAGVITAAIGSGTSQYLRELAADVGYRRTIEYTLHRHHPWLLDALHQRWVAGVPDAELVVMYDRLLVQVSDEGIPADGNMLMLTPVQPHSQPMPIAPTQPMPIAPTQLPLRSATPAVVKAVRESEVVHKPYEHQIALYEFANGATQNLWITGPSGVGKTAFVSELVTCLKPTHVTDYINVFSTEAAMVTNGSTAICNIHRDVDEEQLFIAIGLIRSLRSATDKLLVIDEFATLITSDNKMLTVLLRELAETITATRGSGHRRNVGLIVVGTPVNPKQTNKLITQSLVNMHVCPYVCSQVSTSKGMRDVPEAELTAALTLGGMQLDESLYEGERYIGFGGDWYSISTVTPTTAVANDDDLAYLDF